MLRQWELQIFARKHLFTLTQRKKINLINIHFNVFPQNVLHRHWCIQQSFHLHLNTLFLITQDRMQLLKPPSWLFLSDAPNYWFYGRKLDLLTHPRRRSPMVLNPDFWLATRPLPRLSMFQEIAHLNNFALYSHIEASIIASDLDLLKKVCLRGSRRIVECINADGGHFDEKR